MAIVTGTQVNDFIHRAGDGFGAGGNEISTVTAAADTITGDSGADVIFADAGNDSVTGDDGADTLHGGQGADRLFGGVGNDTFRFIGVSDVSGLAEIINGGNDIDTMDFQTLNASGAVDLTAAVITGVEQLALTGNSVTLTGAQLSAFDVIIGSGFTDRLIVTTAGLVDLTGATLLNIDEIRGNAFGNEVVLTGVASGQVVNTLDGDDSVTGGAGDDRIDGGTGLDSLNGGAGNDSLSGSDGTDSLAGSDGNDTLLGGAGVDATAGGAGNDVFRVTLVGELSGLTETVSGGADLDTLDFQVAQASGACDLTALVMTSVETLLLWGNDITLTAAQLSGFNTVVGSGFADRLILNAGGTTDLIGAVIDGIDEIRGSAGQDVILLTDVARNLFVDGRSGNDSIRGGLGIDTVDGGTGSDILLGNEGADVLRGGQGADSVAGGTGNDLIQITGISDISGLAETLDGGNDNDTLDFLVSQAVGRVNLTLATISNIENLRLFNNVVTLTAAQMGGFEAIIGTGFVERLVLSAAGVADLSDTDISGIDEFTGSAGADTFIFNNAVGVVTVNGLGGGDQLSGGTSNDILLGGSGADTLNGGAGDDVIVGGAGVDQLTGGANGDRFDFNDASESGVNALRDTITDFVNGQDLIDLRDIDANNTVFGNQDFTFIAAAAFGGVAGQLRYGGGILSADMDGDGAADFQIALAGSPVLTVASLFI